MRTIDDTKAINAALSAASVQQPEIVKTAEEKLGVDAPFKPNLVVIGSSFIGMEVALAGIKKANVTVVGMEEAPFEKILGPQVGNALRKNHEKQGIKFYLPAELSHFKASEKDGKKVGAVVLKSGEELSADVVIMGTGVKPVTDYAKNIPGIQLNDKDKSIAVDEQLRLKGINKKNVYAVGDIAYFPDVKTGEQMRIEHWNVAGNHARCVATTITGGKEPYNKVSSATPRQLGRVDISAQTAIFWSAQGAQLRYVGSSKSSKWEDVHIDGTPEDLKFVAYYGSKCNTSAPSAPLTSSPSQRATRRSRSRAWAEIRYVLTGAITNRTDGAIQIVTHCSELYSMQKMPSFSAIKGGKNPLDIPLA